MIKIYIKEIKNFNESESEIIKNTLSNEALKRLNKKRNKDLHLASLCALSLLTNEERSDLCYLESGRPYFKTHDNDISISHSNAFVAVAISNSKNSRVGIDIEDISTNTSTTRFLTENERFALSNGTSHLKIWTKKEALFKFLKNDSTAFIHLDSTMPEIHGATFTTVQIESSILTVCAPPNEKIEIIQIIQK